jgi:hypothetical protein
MVGMGGEAFLVWFASWGWLMWVTCVVAGQAGGDMALDTDRLRRFEEK